MKESLQIQLRLFRGDHLGLEGVLIQKQRRGENTQNRVYRNEGNENNKATSETDIGSSKECQELLAIEGSREV